MGEEDLQLAPMHRIIKKAGAKRVSEDGAEELRKVLERVGIKISKEAIDFANHAKRKTVKSEDIEIAAKKVLKE
ncbi:MAG TPA: histone [Candidatus Bathyarchaeia archaeon]|nr:MAG: histone [Candidatus Bathyarchaeota archaeon RBG_16_48_13]HJX23775.1 histone [Candidatus Bathyarchaeia archaeon]